jgi:hypothetical protein
LSFPERLLNQTGSEAFENNHLQSLIDNDKEEKFLPKVPMALLQPALSISEIEKETLFLHNLRKNQVLFVSLMQYHSLHFYLI